MSDQQVNLVAILTPAPGKTDRLREELHKITQEVYKHEPEVLRYHLHYQKAPEEFVMIERYASKAAFDSHKDQPAFQNLLKVCEAEHLLSKPLELKMLESIGGHDNRG
ncbi:hypothetical protein MMC26_002902 [Xylographa opegraphella]|nr:hypothetical protein [Xylographa opegraphella]